MAVEIKMPEKGLIDQNRFIAELQGSGVAGVAISPIDPSRQSVMLNELAGNTLLVPTTRTHHTQARCATSVCTITCG